MRRAVALDGLVTAPLFAVVGVPSATGTSAAAGDGVRHQRPYTVLASVEEHRVVEDVGFAMVSGRVTPKAVGTQVILQQRLRGSTRWRTTDRTRTTRTSRFTLMDMPRTPGVRYYRVVKPASGGLDAGVSAPLRVVVLDYEWRSLLGQQTSKENLSRQPADLIGTARVGRLTMVDPGLPASIEFDLDGRCELLELGAGMARPSAPESEGWALLNRDGAEDGFYAYHTDDMGGFGASTITDYITGTDHLVVKLGSTLAPPGYTSLSGIKAFCAS